MSKSRKSQYEKGVAAGRDHAVEEWQRDPESIACMVYREVSQKRLQYVQNTIDLSGVFRIYDSTVKYPGRFICEASWRGCGRHWTNATPMSGLQPCRATTRSKTKWGLYGHTTSFP